MINFLKNLILDLFYGKKFEVTPQKVTEYKNIEVTLKALPCPTTLSPTTIIVGNNFKRICMEIPSFFQYRDFSVGADNLVISTLAFQYFDNGGTWKEIEDYFSVLKYGRLHGKRRRL